MTEWKNKQEQNASKHWLFIFSQVALSVDVLTLKVNWSNNFTNVDTLCQLNTFNNIHKVVHKIYKTVKKKAEVVIYLLPTFQKWISKISILLTASFNVIWKNNNN